MKKFINLNDNYNAFELHKCVEDKIYQIKKSKMEDILKNKLYEFIKQIQFKLKENLNYFHKKQEEKFENSYKIDHINAQITDLKKDLLKRSETEKETVYISPINQGLVNPLKKLQNMLGMENVQEEVFNLLLYQLQDFDNSKDISPICEAIY